MLKFSELCNHFNIDIDVDKFVFNALVSLHSSEMTAIGISSDDDFELYLDSQEKTCSLTTEYYFNKYRDYESNAYQTFINKIASMIYNKYYKSWLDLYKAMMSDYNPIENYNMIENENIASEIVNDTKNDNNVFGFNTTETEGVPQTHSTGSVTTSGDYDKNHRQLTRSGNIGVTTTQQMIQSSIELFKDKYFDLIYKDLNNFLFSPIYTK